MAADGWDKALAKSRLFKHTERVVDQSSPAGLITAFIKTRLYTCLATWALVYTLSILGLSFSTPAALSSGHTRLIRLGLKSSPSIWIVTSGLSLTITANCLTTQIGDTAGKNSRSKKHTCQYY
jgi:hypothetical protein